MKLSIIGCLIVAVSSSPVDLTAVRSAEIPIADTVISAVQSALISGSDPLPDTSSASTPTVVTTPSIETEEPETVKVPIVDTSNYDHSASKTSSNNDVRTITESASTDIGSGGEESGSQDKPASADNSAAETRSGDAIELSTSNEKGSGDDIASPSTDVPAASAPNVEEKYPASETSAEDEPETNSSAPQSNHETASTIDDKIDEATEVDTPQLKNKVKEYMSDKDQPMVPGEDAKVTGRAFGIAFALALAAGATFAGFRLYQYRKGSRYSINRGGWGNRDLSRGDFVPLNNVQINRESRWARQD